MSSHNTPRNPAKFKTRYDELVAEKHARDAAFSLHEILDYMLIARRKLFVASTINPDLQLGKYIALIESVVGNPDSPELEALVGMAQEEYENIRDGAE